MTQIQRHAIVPYSAEQMFALVDDVSSYPDFLPWCTKAHELERTPDTLKASVELTKGHLRKSFTTLNENQQGQRIRLKLIEGPFKSLNGDWHFEALQNGQACKVSLNLQFEFSNRLLKMTIGPIFNAIGNSLVDAFVTRAKQVYGKP